MKLIITISLNFVLLVSYAQWTGQTSASDVTSPISRTGMINIDGYNGAQIRLNAQGGAYYGKIGNPSAQVWSLGWGGPTSDINPVLNWTPSGLVGIGTISPSAKLDIDIGASSSMSLALRSTDAASQWSGGLSFSSPKTTAPFYIYSYANQLQFSQRNPDGSYKSQFIVLDNPSGNVLFPNSTGNIGIGTSSPDQKLTVNGIIHTKEVRIDLSVPGPDYVFEKDYKLPSLEQIKSYIDENKHLPEVPSAKEMEANGVNVGEMNMLLLKKVEELTLLMIHLKSEHQAELDLLKKEIVGLKK